MQYFYPLIGENQKRLIYLQQEAQIQQQNSAQLQVTGSLSGEVGLYLPDWSFGLFGIDDIAAGQPIITRGSAYRTV